MSRFKRKQNFEEGVIKFYAGENPEMFEIERRCMDRDGKVIEYLSQNLPKGLILDIGAGNGFTAGKLISEDRVIVPVEPDEKIIDSKKNLIWIKGIAQDLPFHNNIFDGAYSTWAFFFPSMGIEKVREGLSELNRVVKRDGKILIVDNAGKDEFFSLSNRKLVDFESDDQFWKSVGFSHTIVNTSFKFDTKEEARKLLGFYFGEKGKQFNDTEVQYRVVAYEGKSKGV